MSKTKLTLEVATDFDHLEGKEYCFNQILAAAGYTASLTDLLRMARDLDQIERKGDQEAFNEGVLTVCQLVKSLQDSINKNINEICYGAWTAHERRSGDSRQSENNQ
jgi:hypothetical protein